MCTEPYPVDAIEVKSNRILVSDSCIGCGLCAVRCPEEAILMEETVPMKDNLLDHFWGFRPKIRG